MNLLEDHVMVKRGTRDRLHLHVGRLRGFADVTTRGNPDSDAIVLQLVREITLADSFDLLETYRALYRRLAVLSQAGRPRLFGKGCGGGDWARFDALTRLQRSALFLVIGLEFSLHETASVLGETDDRLATEVISALLRLHPAAAAWPAPDPLPAPTRAICHPSAQAVAQRRSRERAFT